MKTRRVIAALAAVAAAGVAHGAPGPHDLPLVEASEVQPLKLLVRRLLESLEFLGNPLPATDRAALEEALAEADEAKASERIQRVLDPHCLVGVSITPEARVSAAQGPASAKLLQHGWRQFLVKVDNRAGVTSALRVQSEQALPLHGSPAAKLDDRWLDLKVFDDSPMPRTLSGSRLEYRILQLYSRDAGKRAAVLTFDVGHGTQDIGFRADVTLTFDGEAAAPLTLGVRDENGQPTMAAFEIRDRQGRTYPSQAKRVPPDFFFHPQVYRYDGETIALPPGSYTIAVTRGPEYLAETKTVTMTGKRQSVAFRLRRWIDPAKLGWWSGDHHIHAAGCSHFTKPTEGVEPKVMVRHVRGEDLKVAASLTWGPGFDHQKQFFTGAEDVGSAYPYLIRYDIEVSGFGSHKSGHLVLLGLKEQIYPGGTSKDHWPTLGLNTLRWAQKQGAVAGPAHSGWGLGVASNELPNYLIPPYDGIGANEYIVDVTHEVPGPDGRAVPAVDFMSTADTPLIWELNVWYHTLNAGFRTRISGETDFPCIYGDRVGMGRSYVAVDGKLTYDKWIRGVEQGRAYVGDGRSHIIDFKVTNVAMGRNGSELRLAGPKKVQVTAQVAALLPETPDGTIVPYASQVTWMGGMKSSVETMSLKPYWHVERARIGKSRKVKLEAILDGRPAGKAEIVADGTLRPIAFEVPVKRSGWLALRILGTAHTNPVFVVVADKPICSSRRSIEWLQQGVEQLWGQKQKTIAPAEMDDAVSAYDHARATYKRLHAVCTPDEVSAPP